MLGVGTTTAEAIGPLPSPDDSTVVLDPAGLRYITKLGPSEAGAASEAIYIWLGIERDQRFHEAVREAITEPLQAKYHEYGRKKCIHVVGPDLRELTYSLANRIKAVEMLATAY